MGDQPKTLPVCPVAGSEQFRFSGRNHFLTRMVIMTTLPLASSPEECEGGGVGVGVGVGTTGFGCCSGHATTCEDVRSVP